MAVDRRPSRASHLLRASWLILTVVLATAGIAASVRQFAAPTSALARYRSAKAPPQVLVRGTLRATDPKTPPLCRVDHERFLKCGKSRCWTPQEGMVTAQAELEVEWSSSPVASRLQLQPSYRFEPIAPAGVVVEGERLASWKTRAQVAKLGFSDASLAGPNDRVVEHCVEDGEKVFVEGCAFGTSLPMLGPCEGQDGYGLVWGDTPQAAIDAAADKLLVPFGVGFLVLLLGALVLVRPPGPIVEGLAQRGGGAPPKLGSWLLLLGVPVLGFAVNFLLGAGRAPSTWATGRGGMIVTLLAAIAWFLFARSLTNRRGRIVSALRPVLATERSLLANASGTVELAVRARLRDGGVAPVLGDAPVAFAQAVVTESYQEGKNAKSIERAFIRPSEALAVSDESGDGVLDLANAVLDVETRTATFKDAPPRLTERGVTLLRHERHTGYVVNEVFIPDGEPLYVFGDVSAVALRAGGEQGYRAVRGSPTLGGADIPPVLVYAGDEDGLVRTLSREARTAHLLAIVASCICGLVSAAMLFLASL